MKITKRTNPSGRVVWQLDKGRDGGGRKSFKTKGDAELALKQERDRQQRHGSIINELTPMDMAEFVTARGRLREVQSTISEATEFFLQHGRRILEPLLVPELVKRFIASRADKKLSDDYISQLGTSLGGLAAQYRLTLAHNLTAKEVKAWNKSDKWIAKTRNNYLGDVSAMYEWAMLPTQGYARINPCVGVERDPKTRRGRKPSLSVEQSEEMLNAAVEQQNWRALAFLVTSLFGGLRPEAEAADQKLEWSDINLDERHIRLSEDVVKTGPGRVVDLTPQAVEWLRLIPADLRHGPVVPTTNWQMVWSRFRYELGWAVISEKVRKKQYLRRVEPTHGRWPKDILRHTYATYHYAHYQNEALLQVQMGHTSAKMIHEYYRAVRTRQEGARYWALAPSVPMPSLPG